MQPTIDKMTTRLTRHCVSAAARAALQRNDLRAHLDNNDTSSQPS